MSDLGKNCTCGRFECQNCMYPSRKNFSYVRDKITGLIQTATAIYACICAACDRHETCENAPWGCEEEHS